MLPRKIFENLQTVMIILALFEQFSGKVDRWPATPKRARTVLRRFLVIGG